MMKAMPDQLMGEEVKQLCDVLIKRVAARLAATWANSFNKPVWVSAAPLTSLRSASIMTPQATYVPPSTSLLAYAGEALPSEAVMLRIRR